MAKPRGSARKYFSNDNPNPSRVFDCAAGSMKGCDELFYRSELNTDYENWGATCGGRFAAQRRDLQFSAAGECDARVFTETPSAGA